MMEEAQAREHLGKLDVQKSMGLDRILPRVLRDLAHVLVRPHLLILERSW